MKKTLLLFSLLFAALSCTETVSVKDFGAVGDGITLDTEAVQAAIDHFAGKAGVVTVPAGTYLCGSIWLRSNIELHLEEGAVIKGSPYIGDYCSADCCPQNEGEPGFGDNTSGGHLLLGVGVRNVTLSGPGKIDGNSDVFLLDSAGVRYGHKSLVPARPSQMVWFVDSEGITLRGIELADSPYWSCFILNCSKVRLEGCYVHTSREPYHTFNGDGIDIDRCQDVVIKDCRVDTSDDCITLRASSAHLLENPQDCSGVLVEDCHLSSSCNAIRIGVGEGHIHDAVIRDIEITDCNTAFNFVCSYSGERGTDIDAILLQDISVEASQLLRMHHMRSKDAKVRDITFDHISGTAPGTSHFWAREAAPFEDIVLRDVDVPALYECVNAQVIVEGGSFQQKELTPEQLARRHDYIENETRLLN